MKRVMNIRVAAVAVAASALIIAPAFAEGPSVRAQFDTELADGRSGLSIQIGHNSHRDYRQSRRHGYGNGHGYGANEWGQTRREIRRLRRSAVRQCRQVINQEAWRIGLRDVDYEEGRRGKDVRQIGRRGFRIHFNDVEFEGRRRDFERDVSCTVRRGEVVRLNGMPERGRHHRRSRRDGDHDYGRRNDHGNGHQDERRSDRNHKDHRTHRGS